MNKTIKPKRILLTPNKLKYLYLDIRDENSILQTSLPSFAKMLLKKFSNVRTEHNCYYLNFDGNEHLLWTYIGGKFHL